jgi:hypothetical protein
MVAGGASGAAGPVVSGIRYRLLVDPDYFDVPAPQGFSSPRGGPK